MNALLLAVSIAAAAPPVTQEEAVAFHASGRCSMTSPGHGITRPDGDGWIVSMLPGPHRIYALGGSVRLERTFGLLDMTPGKAYKIHISPGAEVYWCPQYHAPDRDACGRVPPAFLYNAQKVGD